MFVWKREKKEEIRDSGRFRKPFISGNEFEVIRGNTYIEFPPKFQRGGREKKRLVS